MTGVDRLKLGQTELYHENYVQVEFDIADTHVSIALPEQTHLEDSDYVYGIDEVLDATGDRTRRYVKIPRKLREAGHVVVQYYDNHENLKKGTKAAAVVAGIITVGSLVALRLKNRRN
jgi:hypothetical protein